MSKERLETPKTRLFVALDLPETVRRRLAAWQASVAAPQLRPVAPEALHVTLAFLGFRPKKEIPLIADLVHALEPRPVALSLDPEPVAVPRNRPRLFAIDARSADATDLQADLETRLVGAGVFEPEKRPFWAHVTVFRVRPESRGSRRPARVGRPPALPADIKQVFGTVRITLYRSVLGPEGATYESLAHVDLPPISDRGRKR